MQDCFVERVLRAGTNPRTTEDLLVLLWWSHAAENEAIQKSHLLAVFSTPGLHPTLPQALALANGLDRGQRPSAENPLRLGDRRPGV